MSDLAKYGEVRTIEFDAEQKETWVKKINELLTEGWEIIDAKVAQWSRPPFPVTPTGPTLVQWPAYSFILGKPR